jgi:hypothetical protein
MSDIKLDPKNYCGGKCPESGDGYSDYEISPKRKMQREVNFKAMMESAPDHIKQAMAEARKQQHAA